MGILMSGWNNSKQKCVSSNCLCLPSKYAVTLSMAWSNVINQAKSVGTARIAKQRDLDLRREASITV